MKVLSFIIMLSLASLCHAIEQADAVLVKKSAHELYLLRDGRVLKKFHVMLSPNPWDPKLQEGDDRTPVGHYILDHKNPHSHFYKSIHISYPNAFDIRRARKYDVDPGNDIMIHGMKNDWSKKTIAKALHFNWTDGCIAVKDSDMDQIWNAVPVGTPIDIEP